MAELSWGLLGGVEEIDAFIGASRSARDSASSKSADGRSPLPCFSRTKQSMLNPASSATSSLGIPAQ